MMTSVSKKESKDTQHLKIKRYLKEHKTITPMEAWDELYITKLSTRIGEMERKGKISTVHVMTTNPMTGSRYCTYMLVEDENEQN